MAAPIAPQPVGKKTTTVRRVQRRQSCWFG
jgi:hypothetical protein